MSLPRLRRWSRALSVLLLLASVSGVPHLEVDDPACVPVAEQHDETKHGIRPGAPHQAEHCAVCHWTRTLRAPKPVLAVWIAQFAPSSSVTRERREIPHAPVLEQMPARAPPARSL
jgi:hypothetical protein